MEVTLEKFAAIDQGPSLTVNAQQFVVYRAFLGALGLLSITQHVVSGGSRSYLQFRKASQLAKRERESRAQPVLLSVQVA
jgi:hypothetical protein